MSALLVTLLASAVWSSPPEQLPALELEVLNPVRARRRLIQLDDLIGPSARTIGAHTPVRALLIVSIGAGGEAPGGFDRPNLSKLAQEVSARRGGILAVALVAPRDRGRPGFEPEELPFPVVADPHGLARRKLELLGPGRALVVRSDGRVVAAFGPEEGSFQAARAALLQLLEEEAS
jgi:hypothetical protein